MTVLPAEEEPAGPRRRRRAGPSDTASDWLPGIRDEHDDEGGWQARWLDRPTWDRTVTPNIRAPDGASAPGRPATAASPSVGVPHARCLDAARTVRGCRRSRADRDAEASRVSHRVWRGAMRLVMPASPQPGVRSSRPGVTGWSSRSAIMGGVAAEEAIRLVQSMFRSLGTPAVVIAKVALVTLIVALGIAAAVGAPQGRWVGRRPGWPRDRGRARSAGCWQRGGDPAVDCCADRGGAGAAGLRTNTCSKSRIIR